MKDLENRLNELEKKMVVAYEKLCVLRGKRPLVEPQKFHQEVTLPLKELLSIADSIEAMSQAEVRQ